MVERRFAIVGHRAPSTGKLNLNDLPSACGRMDVLCRAVNTALFLSHGMRSNSHITLHLLAGRPRRIWFDSRTLRGIRVDERAIAGQISKILQEPIPAIGQLVEFSPGLWHGGGGLQQTIKDWQREEVTLVHLDAEASRLWEPDAKLENPVGATVYPEKIGFFLSDDQPFSVEELESLSVSCIPRSLGEDWLQGHSAIAFIHQLMDLGTPFDLNS